MEIETEREAGRKRQCGIDMRERDKGGQTQRGQTEGWRERRKLEGGKRERD